MGVLDMQLSNVSSTTTKRFKTGKKGTGWEMYGEHWICTRSRRGLAFSFTSTRSPPESAMGSTAKNSTQLFQDALERIVASGAERKRA
jgi:hypothetical protein